MGTTSAPSPAPATTTSTSTTPWYWVVQAIAENKQASTSLLRDMIDRAPNFWTAAPPPVRERVALRYLEEQLSPGRAGDPCTSESGPGIDVDRSSEDVLCSHLRKVTTLDRSKVGGAELSSHDLEQFVFQKTTALPKSSLDLLKAVILEGRSKAALTLKEPSGLVLDSQVKHPQCNNIGEHDRVKKCKVSTADGMPHSHMKGSTIAAPDSGKLVSHKNVPVENHLLKQNVSIRNTGTDLQKNIVAKGGNDNIGEHEGAKKLIVNTGDAEVHLQFHGSSTVSPDSGKLILQEKATGVENNLPKHNSSDVDGGNCHQRNAVARGRDTQLLKSSTNQRPNEINHGHNDGGTMLPDHTTSFLDNGNAIVQDRSGPRHNITDRNISFYEMNKAFYSLAHSYLAWFRHKENINLQHASSNESEKIVNQLLNKNDISNVGPAVEHQRPNVTFPSDDVPVPPNFVVHDETFSSEKYRLLNSQVQDSPPDDWSPQGLCIKCDKGGQLLSCSAKGCSISVHETCLGSSLDSKGTALFYCPFCSYTRASIAYSKAQKDFYQAKKALSAFMGKNGVEEQSKNRTTADIPRKTGQQDSSENNHQQQKSCPDESFRNKLSEFSVQVEMSNLCTRHVQVPLPADAIEIDHHETAGGHQGVAMVQDSPPKDAANTVNDGILPCGVKVAYPICENANATLISSKGKLNNDPRYSGVAEHHLEHPNSTTDDENLLHEDVNGHTNRHSDITRVKKKDATDLINCHGHTENFKNAEKVRDVCEYGTEKEALTLRGKRKSDESTAEIHPQETIENHKREKPSSSNANKPLDLKSQEHLPLSPDCDTDNEASDPQPSRGHNKRFRRDAVVDKIHHPLENVENHKREKPLASSSNKDDARNQEQIRVSPDCDTDRETLDSRLRRVRDKRRRHDVTNDRIHHLHETDEKTKNEKPPSGSSNKHRVPSKPSLHTPIQLGRRQKLIWTPEEEQILKEAVQKFPANPGGSFPWTKILEYGRKVFHSTRQPGDLKDKWRNIVKREIKEEAHQ